MLLGLMSVFVVMIAGAASAVPRLQTYIVGSSYQDIDQQGSESWTSNYDNVDLNVVGVWSPVSSVSVGNAQIDANGCFNGNVVLPTWGGEWWWHHRRHPGNPGPGCTAPEPGTLSLLGLGLLGMIPILRRKKD
jgi:hypothetical protein